MDVHPGARIGEIIRGGIEGDRGRAIGILSEKLYPDVIVMQPGQDWDGNNSNQTAGPPDPEAHPCPAPSASGLDCSTLHKKKEFAAGAPRQRSANAIDVAHPALGRCRRTKSSASSWRRDLKQSRSKQADEKDGNCDHLPQSCSDPVAAATPADEVFGSDNGTGARGPRSIE
jgi:hypothetical protein